MIPGAGDGAADQWSSIGPTAKMRFAKTEVRYGTLSDRIPVLLTCDGRLLPQSFQGGQVPSEGLDNVTLLGGIIEHATGGASTDRTGLAAPEGTQESNKFYYAGADYKTSKTLLCSTTWAICRITTRSISLA